MKKFAWLLYAVTSTTFVSLFLIINSFTEMTSANFWGALIWIQVLITLGFLINAKVFSSFGGTTRQSPKLFGILWSFDLSLLIVSLLSGILVVLFLPFSDNFLSNRFFWVLQILLVSISSFVLIFLYMTTRFASTGAEGLPSIQDLKELIKKVEYKAMEFYSDDFNEVKKLYEHVSFKMPHPSKINQNTYLDLIKQLNEVLELIPSEMDAEAEMDAESFNTKIKEIRLSFELL